MQLLHVLALPDLLLSEPQVLFHSSLFLRNLPLVLDQILWYFSKLRLQCPPAAIGSSYTKPCLVMPDYLLIRKTCHRV